MAKNREPTDGWTDDYDFLLNLYYFLFQNQHNAYEKRHNLK
jgi:hypothetical protein